jgi:hypothetical protein
MATPTVTNLNDSGDGSLRTAIADAANGDTINFQPGLVGTITLTSGELDITSSITIDAPPGITVDAQGHSRVLEVGAGTSTVDGLTLTGDRPQRAAASMLTPAPPSRCPIVQ